MENCEIDGITSPFLVSTTLGWAAVGDPLNGTNVGQNCVPQIMCNDSPAENHGPILCICIENVTHLC